MSVLRIEEQAHLFRVFQGEIVVQVQYRMFILRSVGLYMSAELYFTVKPCFTALFQGLWEPEVTRIATVGRLRSEWRTGWREEVLKPDRAGAFLAIKSLLAPLFPSSSLWLSTCAHVFLFFFHKCVCLCLLAKGARSVIYHCVKSHDSDESISSLNPFQHLIIGCHLNIQFPCCMLVHVNLSQRRVCASVTLRMLCYLAQRAAFLRFKDQTNNFSLCFPPLFSGTLNCCAGKRKLKPWTPSKLDVCGWRSINE